MRPRASTLEWLVRRDRAIVGAALALVAILAWAYVIRLAGHMMGHGAMSGMATPAIMAPELKEWSAADGAFMFIMWAVMMTAMMTPSVGPMVLIHARVARQALAGGTRFATTGWFAAGYLLAWTGFAAAATAAQWLLERAALLTPGMHLSNLLGGTGLIPTP